MLHLFDREPPGPSMAELMTLWSVRTMPPWTLAKPDPSRVWALSYVDNTERGADGRSVALYATKEAALFAFVSEELELRGAFERLQDDAQAFTDEVGERPVDLLAEVMGMAQDLRDDGYSDDGDTGYTLEEFPVLR